MTYSESDFVEVSKNLAADLECRFENNFIGPFKIIVDHLSVDGNAAKSSIVATNLKRST